MGPCSPLVWNRPTPSVHEANWLNCDPTQLKTAIRLINKHGSVRGERGLPETSCPDSTSSPASTAKPKCHLRHEHGLCFETFAAKACSFVASTSGRWRVRASRGPFRRLCSSSKRPAGTRLTSHSWRNCFRWVRSSTAFTWESHDEPNPSARSRNGTPPLPGSPRESRHHLWTANWRLSHLGRCGIQDSARNPVQRDDHRATAPAPSPVSRWEPGPADRPR